MQCSLFPATFPVTVPQRFRIDHACDSTVFDGQAGWLYDAGGKAWPTWVVVGVKEREQVLLGGDLLAARDPTLEQYFVPRCQCSMTARRERSSLEVEVQCRERTPDEVSTNVALTPSSVSGFWGTEPWGGRGTSTSFRTDPFAYSEGSLHRPSDAKNISKDLGTANPMRFGRFSPDTRFAAALIAFESAVLVHSAVPSDCIGNSLRAPYGVVWRDVLLTAVAGGCIHGVA
jgi:hypothetical protein